VADQSLITVDPEILGGTPVFSGTRVPVKTLFEYLEDNYSLNEFTECFPTVSREMAHRILEESKDALLEPREHSARRMRAAAAPQITR
jgi:uncharacterized protein (DUF433 family)